MVKIGENVVHVVVEWPLANHRSGNSMNKCFFVTHSGFDSKSLSCKLEKSFRPFQHASMLMQSACSHYNDRVTFILFLFSDPTDSERTNAVFLQYSRLQSQEKYCFSPDSKLLYSRCSKYMTYVTLSFDRKRKNWVHRFPLLMHMVHWFYCKI